MEARELSKPEPRPFQLSLRIRHPSMDPAEVSRELRLKPEHSFKAGEPRESSSGIAATSVHAESYWLGALDLGDLLSSSGLDISLPGRPSPAVAGERLRTLIADSLSIALGVCTSRFLRSHADFLRRIESEGGQAALLVEIAPGAMQGFTITPQIGRSLSELGVSIDFEFMSS